MPPPNPPFPRRGIPSRKAEVRYRRELPRPFLKTKEGKRLMIYGLVAVFAVGAFMLSGMNRALNAPQGPDSRPESRAEAVPLTQPPRSFAPPELLHQLVSVEDYTEDPHPGAIAAAIQYLDKLGDSPTDWTELNIQQAIAHPDKFRGGHVKIEGHLLRLRTKDFPHPSVPDRLLYEGWFIARDGRLNIPVRWVTKTFPPDVPKSTALEGEGVFVQTVEYQDGKDVTRQVPFVVLRSLRVPVAQAKTGFLDRLFGPTVIVLIIVILATTLFLIHKSRRSAPPSRYIVRPPGPGS